MAEFQCQSTCLLEVPCPLHSCTQKPWRAPVMTSTLQHDRLWLPHPLLPRPHFGLMLCLCSHTPCPWSSCVFSFRTCCFSPRNTLPGSHRACSLTFFQVSHPISERLAPNHPIENNQPIASRFLLSLFDFTSYQSSPIYSVLISHCFFFFLSYQNVCFMRA